MINQIADVNLSSRRCIIFDYDGTLADTKPTIVSTASKVLLEWGVPADEVASKVDQLVGPPFPQAFCQIFGMSCEDADEVTRRYRAIYRMSGPEAWPFFTGTRELLSQLRESGKLVAIASSKPQHLIDRGLEDNHVVDLFDAAVGSRPDEVSTKQDAIRLVLQELGCAPEEAVMVGDRFHDVEGAETCGIPCAGVLWGDTGTREELECAGAAAVVDTVDELARVLSGR